MIGDYRPISLVKCNMKIVSKVLSDKLEPILEKEIGQYKTCFIINRNILNGVVIVQKIIHQINKRKEEGYIFQIEKAYDTED